MCDNKCDRSVTARVCRHTSLYIIHESETFKSDFSTLFAQNQEHFAKPEGWQNKRITDSPIIKDLSQSLKQIYLKELPDLAYKDIPATNKFCNDYPTSNYKRLLIKAAFANYKEGIDDRE